MPENGVNRITSPLVSQLSFFSADFTPPTLADLGGLLAAHGQVTVNSRGARLSILLADRGRAEALIGECRIRGVSAEVRSVEGPGPQLLMRTERSPELNGLAADWTRGAVKSVPQGFAISAGFARIWAIAAGHLDDSGYLLGLDPHHPDMIDGLVVGCGHAGIAGSYIGVRGGGPAIRIVGHRRLLRLIDTIGTLPAGLPLGCYPAAADPLRTYQRQA